MTVSIAPTAVLSLLRGQPVPIFRDDQEDDTPALLRLGGLSFDDAVMEALQHHGNGELAAGSDATEEASRVGIDPALLVALRRTENGRPGREFGVLSLAADGHEAQMHVAANTVRNNILRFERTGSVAVDAATSRYSEAFLRFLSSRYAPVGAANDPAGLNRHHAANLIALYRKVTSEDG